MLVAGRRTGRSRLSDLAVDLMVGCMFDCRIDMAAGCYGRVLGYSFGIEAAEVAADMTVARPEIFAVGIQATARAVAAVRMDSGSARYGLALWSRPMPKDCDQPSCGSGFVICSVFSVGCPGRCLQLIFGHARLDRQRVVL